MAQNNYSLQAAAARARFLTYDQEALIQKHRLEADPQYLYSCMLGRSYRIHRKSGSIECREQSTWVDANTFEQTLTLLDLLCDSRPDRHICRREKAQASFGQMFHRNLAEVPSEEAFLFDREPEGLKKACLRLGGTPCPGGDISFRFPFFEELCMTLRFWHSDEEFPPQLRWYWDENALAYLRYETMYYADRLLLNRITEEMGAITYGA